MEDANMSGRQTPGVGGGKPSTPGPQNGPPAGSGPLMPPSSMGPNHNATSHGGGVRYPYGPPPQMHPGYGPQMMPQGGHPGMGPAHHAYGQGAPYGAPASHQMHPSQQQQQGGQFHGMPMNMMPPPSQYPNKGGQPGQQAPPPAGHNPSAAPLPHQQHMMPSDRSMPYGQQRFGPGGQGHAQSQPSPAPSSTHHQPPNAYYMRPPMGAGGQGAKNYYGPNGPPSHPGPQGYGPPGQHDMRMSMQQQMMMSAQHPSHHQQHQMMMHHHQMQQQQQQPVGYGAMGQHMGESGGREQTSTTSSVTHTTASSAASNHSSSDGHRHPQPPPIMDEVSQTSTTSSQAADDSCQSADMPMSSGGGHKSSKHHLSHPSTPNTSNLGSPGAASMSSFHDDFDSVSSPSWPRTPASPALNSSQFSSESHHHSSSKRNDGIQKLYEISDEPERRAFLDKYLQFQEERGQPLTQVPTISKIPLDLFRLYISVRERGGFSEVTKGKLWKECAQLCNIANSSSAAYTLRKQYMKHMLHFECKFDRGGIDPAPVILQLDAATNSKKKTAALKASNAAAANAASAGTAASSASSAASQQPRLSPHSVDASAQPVPYGAHHGGPPGGPYDAEGGHSGFPPPNAGPHPYGHGPHPSGPYQHGHNPPADYPHYLPGGHNAASAQHMPPPPPPGSQHGGGQAPSAPTPHHNESVSVKDPFADDDLGAGATNSSPNYPPAPSRQPHYAMHPGSQGPYYNPMAPSLQAQSHAPYPEGHPSHGQPAHYPVDGGAGLYGRPPSAAPPGGGPESGGAAAHSHPHFGAPGGAYQARMPSNGPSPHGYYAAQSHSPYESQGPPGHHHLRPPFPESGHHVPRPQMTPSPHEHYGGHAGQQGPPAPGGHSHSGSMHRYPNSAQGSPNIGYGPRGPVPPLHASAGQHGPQSTPPYNSSAEAFSKGSEAYNQSGPRMQSPLAQRLLAAKEPPSSTSQPYPANQPYASSRSSSPMGAPPREVKGQPGSGHHHSSSSSSSYQPMQQQANSNISWMPTSRYGAPKRHPDFAKLASSENAFPQSGGPYQQQTQYPPYQPTPPKQSPGQAWSRTAEQYRMGSPSASPYMQGHPGPYGGPAHSRGGEQQRWHENRSPSVPPTSLPSSDGPPQSNWPPPSSRGYGPADYARGSLHEQFNSPSGHSQAAQQQHNQKMMAAHYNHRGEPGPGSGYMMHSQHQSPGKIALSNQLAERRGPGLFPHSPAPPLFVAAGQQHQHQQQQHQAINNILKRDLISFPPGSVEATVPTLTKHRKLTSREFTAMGPIDAWRLFMSLKSGLLAETTYALDVLNVYSNDDSSLSYLGLNNMPGLLEVLLEHYKCYLNEMFDGLFEDTEIGFEARQLRYELDNVTGKYCPKREKEGKGVKRKLKWYELARDYEEEDQQSEEESGDEDNENGEDEMGLFIEKHFKESPKSRQVVLTNTTNYTHVTRNGLPVKYKRTKSLFITDYDKSWDQIKNGFAIGHEHWARGGGETTSHIVSHFEPKESNLRFVRTMKGSKTTSSLPAANGDCEYMETDKVENENDQTFEETGSKVNDNDNSSVTNGHNQYPKIRESDQARYLKSQQKPEYEEESYEQEESPIVTGRDYHESIKARVLTVSNLIRNLTFVPGNDVEMCKHSGLLLVLSRLILLHHKHATRKRQTKSMDLASIKAMDENSLALEEEEEEQEKEANQKKAKVETMLEKEWFSDALHLLRENTLVTLANLSCHLKLAPFPDAISLNLLNGILHWATCPSSYAQDSLPAAHFSLSPKRLAYETLTKLSIAESNVDLILATPWDRIDKLLGNLVRSLGRHEEQTMREFAVVLLSNFSSETSAARAIALTGKTIPLLVSFIEQAEQAAMHVVGVSAVYGAFRETPDQALGTTVDMIRRAAATLRNISRLSENRPLFIQFEARLVALAMSPLLDQSVAVIIADILYESSFVSAKKQLLFAADARTPSANGGSEVPGDGNVPIANNSSAGEHLHLKASNNDENKKETTLKQMAGQKAGAECGELSETAKNQSAKLDAEKASANGPTCPSANSDKSSTLENAEKVKNHSETTKTAKTESIEKEEKVVKAVETSNGLEHKSASKNHIGQAKSELNNKSINNNVVSRAVSNGVMSNNEKEGKGAKHEQDMYDSKSAYGNLLPSVDFFSGRKAGAVLPLVNDVKAPNHANYYYPSPYPSSRDHLSPPAKGISSNGLAITDDELNKKSPNAASIDSGEVEKSVGKKPSVMGNDLNSAVGVSATLQAAAIVEPSSI